MGKMQLSGVIACAFVVSAPVNAQTTTTPAGDPGQVPAASTPVTGTTGATVQPGQNEGLADIVVTAQRRSENLQRAAISVSVISNQALLERNVTDVTQLTQIAPSLDANAGQGSYVIYSIRGIGNAAQNTFADPAVVVNVDGVPLSHPTGAHGLFYDVERVEVLKGPQGTLYGRNATGGAINVLAAKPSFDFGGYLNVAYGNYNRRYATGALNLPVSDTLAVRVAGQIIRRDGYFNDGTGDESGEAVRGSVRFKPDDDLTIDLVADYAHDGGKGPGATLIGRRDTIGGPAGDVHFIVDPWTSNASTDPRIVALYGTYPAPRSSLLTQDNRYFGATAQIGLQTGIGMLTAIGSYRGSRPSYVSNVTGYYLVEDQRTNQYSGEVRLASRDDHPIRYLLGAFYLTDQLNSHYFTESTPTTLSNQVISNGTQTYAGFGQLTWAIVPAFRVTGGLRYTHERRTTDSTRSDIGFAGTAPFPFATGSFSPLPANNAGVLRFTTVGDVAVSAVNYKAGLEWDVASRSLLYANVSSGFKAGGFFFGPPGRNSYAPERVTAYVVGSKNRFLDNRLQINAEGFYYRYRDQQISHTLSFPAPFGNIFATDNAGKATVYGGEIEAQFAATPTTRLNFQGQYLHARYDQLAYQSPVSTVTTVACPAPQTSIAPVSYTVDCSGRPELFSPTWVISGGIEQTIRLSGDRRIVGSVDSRFSTARETSINYLPESRVPSYTRTNLNVTYHAAGDRWTLGGYLLNVEDKAVITQVIPGRNFTLGTGGTASALLQDPRTYGVRAGVKF